MLEKLSADFVRKVPIVKVLVDNGVNVNAREYNGETPLHAIAHSKLSNAIGKIAYFYS